MQVVEPDEQPLGGVEDVLLGERHPDDPLEERAAQAAHAPADRRDPLDPPAARLGE